MKILDSESCNNAWSVNFKLDELISALAELDGQDYFDVSELEKIRDQVKSDMNEYKQSLKDKLKVKEGDIFMITSSDGVSGVRKTFYQITKIRTDKAVPDIEYDLLEVFEGEFKKEIRFNKKESDYLECFLNSLTHYKQEIGTQVLVDWNYYTNLIKDA